MILIEINKYKTQIENKKKDAKCNKKKSTDFSMLQFD